MGFRYDKIKLKYSFLTLSFIQCCNKDAIIYSGASVSVFIRAIRPLISIDYLFVWGSSTRLKIFHSFEASPLPVTGCTPSDLCYDLINEVSLAFQIYCDTENRL